MITLQEYLKMDYKQLEALTDEECEVISALAMYQTVYRREELWTD